MKLIKIRKDHYLIVDDSEIKEGDWVCIWNNVFRVNHYSKEDNQFYIGNHLENIGLEPASAMSKITHSTVPLDKYYSASSYTVSSDYKKVKHISLPEVKQLIGEVDIEEKAKEYLQKVKEEIKNESQHVRIGILGGSDFGFIEGYNQALEDNMDKAYTVDDMKYMFECGRNYQNNAEITFNVSMGYLQPKTEWEVEFVNNKLKLK